METARAGVLFQLVIVGEAGYYGEAEQGDDPYPEPDAKAEEGLNGSRATSRSKRAQRS